MVNGTAVLISNHCFNKQSTFSPAYWPYIYVNKVVVFAFFYKDLAKININNYYGLLNNEGLPTPRLNDRPFSQNFK